MAARRSPATSALKRIACGSSSASTTPFGADERGPIAWESAWASPPPVWSLPCPLMTAASISCRRGVAWSGSAATRGSQVTTVRSAWASSASASGSTRVDCRPSTAIDKMLRAADQLSRGGAVRAITGSSTTPWARALGSKSASRSPVAGSRTAAPALAYAVVGELGTTHCGSFGAASLGLTRRPSASRRVHSSRTSRPSPSRIVAARAVTTDEPPPTAITASAACSTRNARARSTDGSGLCSSTSANWPANRSPSASWSLPIASVCAATAGMQTITARCAPTRASSRGSAASAPSPQKVRKDGVTWRMFRSVSVLTCRRSSLVGLACHVFACLMSSLSHVFAVSRLSGRARRRHGRARARGAGPRRRC